MALSSVDTVWFLCGQTSGETTQPTISFVIKPCLDLTQIHYISLCFCCCHLLVLCGRRVFQLCDLFHCCMNSCTAVIGVNPHQANRLPLPWLRLWDIHGSKRYHQNLFSYIISAQSRPVPVTSVYYMVTIAQEMFIEPWIWILRTSFASTCMCILHTGCVQ